MKYDERKLNAYWEEREFTLDTWYNNGWQGPGTPKGRDVAYPCGHMVWAGYGISLALILKHKCTECLENEKTKKEG